MRHFERKREKVGELKFVIKTLIATILIVAIMQIKVGQGTIESKAYQVLAKSKVADFLNDVAQGLVRLGEQTKEQVERRIKKINAPNE